MNPPNRNTTEPNRNTTELVLGAMYIREDLLRQEAHNSRMGGVASRMARWVRMIARPRG